MKYPLERLLTQVELSGCAVAPVHVDAMVKAIRKLTGLVSDLAQLLYDAECLTDDQMENLCDRMEDSRTCEMPTPIRRPG